MVGEAGGGFIFDTNALHRGEVDGRFERNTVGSPVTSPTRPSPYFLPTAAAILTVEKYEQY